jgi:type I restriction enzyme S subunit
MGLEWREGPLEHLAGPERGSIAIGPFGSRMKADCYVEKGVALIRGTNLGHGKSLSGEFVFITSEKAAELGHANLKPTDLVFPHRGAIGEVGIVPDDGRRYALSTSLMKITLDPNRALPEFYYYYFKGTKGQAELLKNASQVGTPGISTPLKSLRECVVPLPTLAEQAGAVAVLRSLDDRIHLLRQTNTTLEAIAQALFKSWFVDFDPVHAKAEGREPEAAAQGSASAAGGRMPGAAMDAATAALFPSEFEASELGLIPKGWLSPAVYDLAQFINGAAYKAFDPNREKLGLPIIKIAELKAGVTEQTAYSGVEMPAKYRIDTGDILFSWSGNPDTSIDTFVWPSGSAWLNQHIFRVVPHSSDERSFVLLALKYLRPVFAEIARDKQTTGLGHVTVADLKRLRIVKPDEAVLEQWNLLVDPLVARTFAVQRQAQTLSDLRDTLLPRLISGKLRLPNAEREIEATA